MAISEGAEHMGAVEFPGGERRVMTSRAEAYVEVMCPEDGCEEAAS